MLPFIGYHVGDYFGHWLEVGQRVRATGAQPPRMFCVNWFRTDEQGRFVWPGYAENMRVLEWIVGRVSGSAGGRPTFLGVAPRHDDLHWEGLPLDAATFERAVALSADDWRRELESHAQFFERIGDRVPAELNAVRQRLLARLSG
jgi:phosphoenolpyruvate carboxykinase (GTP)